MGGALWDKIPIHKFLTDVDVDADHKYSSQYAYPKLFTICKN